MNGNFNSAQLGAYLLAFREYISVTLPDKISHTLGGHCPASHSASDRVESYLLDLTQATFCESLLHRRYMEPRQ